MGGGGGGWTRNFTYSLPFCMHAYSVSWSRTMVCLGRRELGSDPSEFGIHPNRTERHLCLRVQRHVSVLAGDASRTRAIPTPNSQRRYRYREPAEEIRSVLRCRGRSVATHQRKLGKQRDGDCLRSHPRPNRVFGQPHHQCVW